MNPYVKNLHGDAALLRSSHADLSWIKNPASGSSTALVLAHNPDDEKAGLVWDLASATGQGHGLTIGTNRSGKGVSAIIPGYLTYGGSIFGIDPKGENAWITAPRRRMMGQKTVVLDPWNQVNRLYGGPGIEPEPIAHYNPLSTLDPADEDFADDCTSIADALIIPAGNANSHWTDSARDMLAGLIAWTVEEDRQNASLRTVRRLLTLPLDTLKLAIANYIEVSPDSVGGLKLAAFAGVETGNTEQSGIRSTAKTQTSFLDSAALLRSLDTSETFATAMEHLPRETSTLDHIPNLDGQADGSPSVDLSELATGRMTVYLVLPADKLQTHARWLRLMVTMIIRSVVRSGAANPLLPVLGMLDEFGTIGTLAVVEQAFGLMSGLGLRIWAFVQDLNQLQRDYPESWETFIANSSILQILNAKDLTTSKYISEMLGTTTFDFQEGSQAVERAYFLNDEEKKKIKFSLIDGDKYATYKNKYVNDPRGNAFYMRKFIEPIVHQLPRQLMLPQEVRKISRSETLVIMEGENYLMPRLHYFKQFAHWVRPLPAFRSSARLTIEDALGRKATATSPALPPIAVNDNAPAHLRNWKPIQWGTK